MNNFNQIIDKNYKKCYKCKNCNKTFGAFHATPHWVKPAYEDYLLNRFTLAQIVKKYKKSKPTINKYFDKYELSFNFPRPKKETEINLIFDATYFKRK